MKCSVDGDEPLKRLEYHWAAFIFGGWVQNSAVYCFGWCPAQEVFAVPGDLVNSADSQESFL